MKQYIIVLVLALLAGFCANSLQPILHDSLPSDFSRTNFILKTLLEDEQAEVSFFGNSIAMSGINASLIEQEVRSVSSAYNLASNGQYLSESLLYYPLISEKCKLVVQMVRSIELEEDLEQLDNAVMRNFYFGGYPTDSSIEKDLEIDIGLSYLNKTSKEQLKYDQRGILVNAINNGFRSALRNDLNLEKLKTELHFPNVYNNVVSEENLKKMISLYNPESAKTEFSPSAETVKLVQKVEDYFNAKGIKYVLVFFPYNPVLDNYTPAYTTSVNQFAKDSGLPIISLLGQMSEGDFVDHCHLTRDGGTKLTNILINKLRESNYVI